MDSKTPNSSSTDKNKRPIFATDVSAFNLYHSRSNVSSHNHQQDQQQNPLDGYPLFHRTNTHSRRQSMLASEIIPSSSSIPPPTQAESSENYNNLEKPSQSHHDSYGDRFSAEMVDVVAGPVDSDDEIGNAHNHHHFASSPLRRPSKQSYQLNNNGNNQLFPAQNTLRYSFSNLDTSNNNDTSDAQMVDNHVNANKDFSFTFSIPQQQQQQQQQQQSTRRNNRPSISLADVAKAKFDQRRISSPSTPPPQNTPSSTFASATGATINTGNEESSEASYFSFSPTRGSPAATDSGSNSEFPTGGGAKPVQRIVKRSNLLPKTRAHLRVAGQLAVEARGLDQAEMASEAALHRQSRAAVAPPRTPRTPTASRSNHNNGGTPNRFPESVDEDDDTMDRHDHENHSDSSEEFSIGSDPIPVPNAAAASLSNYNHNNSSNNNNSNNNHTSSMDDSFEIRMRRDSFDAPRSTDMAKRKAINNTGNSNAGPIRSSPSSRMSFDMDSRNNSKRKIIDSDRFEPYASMAFKRRAVSPSASTSPSLGSPLLTSSSGIPQIPTANNFNTTTTTTTTTSTTSSSSSSINSASNPPLLFTGAMTSQQVADTRALSSSAQNATSTGLIAVSVANQTSATAAATSTSTTSSSFSSPIMSSSSPQMLSHHTFFASINKHNNFNNNNINTDNYTDPLRLPPSPTSSISSASQLHNQQFFLDSAAKNGGYVVPPEKPSEDEKNASLVSGVIEDFHLS